MNLFGPEKQEFRDVRYPNYCYKLITIHGKGSIGMYIVDKEDKIGSKNGCIVESLRENGQGKQCGVLVNDEVFFVPDDIRSGDKMIIDNENLVGASSQQMKRWSQSHERPLQFLVRRCIAQISDSKNDAVCDVRNFGKEVKDDQTKISIDLTKNDIDRALRDGQFPTVPCCKKCNGKLSDSKFHHYLCHKHPEFKTSGAKEKLILILAGIRDKCEGCQYEFVTGKTYRQGHSSKCGRSAGNKRLKVARESKKKGLQKEDKKQSKDFISRPKKSTRPSKLKKDIVKNNTKVKNKEKEIVNKEKKKEAKTVNVVPVTPIVSIDSLQKPTCYQDNTLPLHLTDDSKPQWVSCPNPWGDRAHGEGDFVLLSPDCYKLVRVTQGTMPQRFILNPFDSESSQYFQTHRSPQEGYRVLQLERDALALRSWGFEFAYHDFGGACLVTEVEPFSPADAAVS